MFIYIRIHIRFKSLCILENRSWCLLAVYVVYRCRDCSLFHVALLCSSTKRKVLLRYIAADFVFTRIKNEKQIQRLGRHSLPITLFDKNVNNNAVRVSWHYTTLQTYFIGCGVEHKSYCVLYLPVTRALIFPVSFVQEHVPWLNKLEVFSFEFC